MTSVLGSLRRLALAPSLASVSFEGRAFPSTSSPRSRKLEAIPQAVICGFEWGIDCSGLWELERRIQLVEPELRGFAYEGAAMAAVVMDAMGGFRSDRTLRLLGGPALPHLVLTYIGVGFAMARLPRPLWRKVLPDLPGVPPTMSWLAVDGYAFDRAYFDTRKWVTEQYTPPTYPWQGRADYFPRAVDQGVGRALWFVHGGEVDEVVAALERFPEHRRDDLWAGVGLAASMAGGADRAELEQLRTAAGAHWRQLGLGAVFAATARTAAGHVPVHTEEATAALADLTVAGAVELAGRTVVGEDAATSEAPAYELWRGAIRDELPGRRVLRAS